METDDEILRCDLSNLFWQYFCLVPLFFSILQNEIKEFFFKFDFFGTLGS